MMETEIRDLSAKVLVALFTYWIAPTGIAYAKTGFTRLLSIVINAWLLYTKPIESTDNPHRQIPSCPYQFPNGQGDVAKFLEGTENSAVWSRTYGNVYRIWSGTNPEIVLSDASDIKTVFRDSHKHAKALNNNAGRVMEELLGSCVGLINHQPYKTLRAALEADFSAAASTRYVEGIVVAVASHFKASHDDSTSNLAKGQIYPVADLKMLPFWVVAHIIYGELDDAAKAELQSLIPLREGLFMSMIQGGITRFAWSRYLPLRINKDLRKWRSAWKSLNDRLAAKSPSSLIGRLQRRVDNGEFTEDQLLQTIDEMLFANLDVTMGAISWNLVFLAAYPEYQKQLRQELEQQTKGAEEGELLQNYIKSETTLVHACMLESSRLRPLAAFSVPQSAPTARIVGGVSLPQASVSKTSPSGYAVPAGTTFTIDTHTLNIRQPFWGKTDKERYAFRPERFLHVDRSEARYNYWRYGFGPRQCLGKFVADAMIKALLVHLVENYELRLPKGESEQDWLRDPKSWIAHPKIVLRCTERGKQ